tara:strand:+ start:107 stop:1471 length:1365 start_codon:yes stop_codon:yes gene_type:complete
METLQRAANRGNISTGYDIDNSVKLEYANTEGFTFTNGSTGDGQTWTVSYWFKRTSVGEVFDIGFGANGGLEVGFFPAGEFYFNNGGYLWKSNALYRDTSAWYHVVVSIDTTQGTAANRIRVYINGEEVTSLATDAPPSQNTVLKWNVTGYLYYIGYWPFANYYSKGYYADFHSVDGQQLAPTAFGEFDEDSGIWKPKAYAGSYGTNGFKLEFKDSADLAADTSGNSKSITANNITSADQATDTPTNNFCTWNPLWRYLYQPIISEGGTKAGYSDSTDENAKGSIGVINGKWYWEAKPVGTIGSQFIGIATANTAYTIGGAGLSQNYMMVIEPQGRYYSYSGSLSESAAGQFTALTTSSWLGIALDMDSATKTIKYYVDGSLILTRDLISDMQDRTVFPFLQNYESRSFYINFGGYTINTISSAASDGNGYGTFEYAPPSGYYALCTKNLAEYG